MLKDFIGKQTAFNKSVEEKLGKIDILTSKVDSLFLKGKRWGRPPQRVFLINHKNPNSHPRGFEPGCLGCTSTPIASFFNKVDSLALDVELLKLKVLPNDVKESNTFAATNVIQVRIDKNVRMLAELHARWEREDEIARKMKVCTINTSNDVVPNASNPLTLFGVEKSPTPCAKKPKTAKTFSTKVLNFFRVWEMIALFLLMILMLMAAIYLKLFCSCKSLL
jgi:hypothetical protein